MLFSSIGYSMIVPVRFATCAHLCLILHIHTPENANVSGRISPPTRDAQAHHISPGLDEIRFK